MRCQWLQLKGADVKQMALVAVVLVAFAACTNSPRAELSDTSWRLVRITSMDDRVFEPGDRDLYGLRFAADGSASVLADCNRGRGQWNSDSAGQLNFGPIAATRAECGPDSLSSRYLAQFEFVRSYVLREDHLFLATMADGSIIEFERVTVD